MIKILFIDDDENALRLGKLYLGKYGYEIATAADTQQARRILKTVKIDLIICDVGLPGEDGTEFYRALKHSGQFKNIPFIFVSGHAMGFDESLLSEKDHFVLKPVFFPELARKIEELI